MARWFEDGYIHEDCYPVDDLKAAPILCGELVDKEEQAVYFLTLLADGRPDVHKIIVDSIVQKDANSPIESVRAHFFGMPNQRIIFKEPYLFFGTIDELKEYYRNNI